MPVLKADQVAPALLRGSSAKADAAESQPPRVKVNDSVEIFRSGAEGCRR